MPASTEMLISLAKREIQATMRRRKRSLLKPIFSHTYSSLTLLIWYIFNSDRWPFVFIVEMGEQTSYPSFQSTIWATVYHYFHHLGHLICCHLDLRYSTMLDMASWCHLCPHTTFMWIHITFLSIVIWIPPCFAKDKSHS